MTEYLTLEEKDAGRHTVYTAAPVTRDAIRKALEGALLAVQQGVKHVSEAIDLACPNVDNGATYLCTYDLRQAVGERCAFAAGRLKVAGTLRTPELILREALNPTKARELVAA